MGIFLSILFSITLGSALGWAQTPKADLSAGKAKYNQFCATCHGASGKGDGPAAAALNPKPRNLSATKRSDAELKKIIKEGGAANGMSPLMPPWGPSLSEQDVTNLIAYIRSLAKGVVK